MSFPVTDWQFWIVTLTAAGSLWALVKPFLPGDKDTEATGPCSHCGAAAGSPCARPEDDPGTPLVTLGGQRSSR